MQRANSAQSGRNGAPTAAAQDEAEHVIAFSNLPTIIRLLDDACSKRAALTLKLESGAKLHVFHSRIQSLDAVRMQLVLHKLTPSNWTELLTREFDVEVNCLLPSGLLRFNSTLAPFDTEAVNPYCVLALPGTLYKHQLRSTYRVMVPPGSSSLSLPLGERRLQGYCLNLSLEGCCGIFRGDLGLLSLGTRVPGLTLSLDDALQLSTDATVCRHQLMQNGSTQLGLRFDPLDTELQRKLQASLSSLQRRQLRRQA